MSRRRDALDYHAEGRPGKVAIRPTKPLQTQRDLSLAYTPGVAEPCLEIAEHPERVFDYTARGNLVAVVSNGTAVLGLGDIGPAASKPVMEGKGVLFKRFADIDVFDIEIDARDPDQVIDVVAALEPTFGGINLEDIKAPECFYIEEKLRERMQIPVFHDDQHGTAIIAAAAFVNALEIVDKKAEDVRCVFSGAGAAALACAHLFIAVGVRPENLILCDSRGVIHTGREKGMNPYKARLAVDTSLRTLEEAMKDADVFVGVSAKGVVSKDMVRSMARDPIVMAMANPDPEISYPDAVDAREDIVMATGRSDYPNQVNNVLGFPFIFRGALDVRATGINEEMKLAAVHALAELAKDEVPEDVKQAYGAANLRFGREYIIPKPFDWRALLRVAPAVAKAAMDSGVARRPIEDFDAYRARLEVILGREREVMRAVIRKAARTPKRVVFPEGDSLKILRAAQLCVEEGIARPIVLGEPDVIEALAAEHEIALEGVRIIDNLHDPHVAPYEEAYWQRRRRRGVTRNEAARIIRRRNHFGSMMVELGDADAMVSGMTRSYPDTVRPPLEVIGPRLGVRRVAGAHLVILSDRVKIFADTTVNVDPTAEDLAEIAIATAAMARRLDIEPHIAMLSFSNFGSNAAPQARKVKRAVEILRERAPDLDVDGEMQVDPAIDVAKRERLFEFCTLKAEANVLIFPELNSANIAYKLMKGLGDAEVVGPILIGMNRPVNVLERDCSVRSVLNMVAISVVQAQEMAPPVGAGQEGQGLMEPLPAGWQDWDAARLAAAIREHNARYWDENAPTISDYDFDRLVEALRLLDPDAPALTALGPSPGALGDPVEHTRPMLSLDKAYDEESLHKWAAKFEGDLVMTPKIDGLACSIRYEGGRLAVAATRGSGEVGEDVTINVRLMDDVPATLPTTDPVEVRGEIYLPLSAFHALEGDFANPRNTAAGALKHKDPVRFRAMGLRFFAYDVLGVDIDTEMHKFDLAASWGFAAVEHELVTRENVQAGYEAYVAKREQLDFEIDGVVFKANRLDEQARLGATSHHPRYAIAYKLQGESATTWLRDVEWSVSRNGVLTPVGIVEPVKLSGATVTRISLHNWGLVQAKGLSLNAQVVAMRRGGVIPYLEAVVEPGDTPIVPPDHCPSCGAAAEVEGDLVWCRNPAGCRAQTIAVLSHYAKTVDIEGFGQVWLEKLLDAGLLHWPPDFYRLKPIDLLEFERMGEVLAGKMIDAIDARRVVALPTFLQALGVKDLGKTAARTLAERYGTLEAVRAATAEQLVELPKFAELLANRVVDGLAERAELIDALLEHVEVTPVEVVTAPAGGPLEGQSFLFTATLAAMKRADAEDKVRALGGTVASGVSKSLGFLVVGSEGKAGSKLQKAEKAGVTILDEATFLERLAEAEAEAEG